MNIAFVVNKLTATSIPATWQETFNKHLDLNIETISFHNISIRKLQFLASAKIIHGHQIKMMAVCLLFSMFFSGKTMFTVHGSFFHLSSFNKILIRFIFKRSDYVVFVNKFLLDELPVDLKRLLDKKIDVILNGTNISPKVNKIDLYRKYGIPIECPVVFHPARFVEEKNHYRVLKGFKRLIANNKGLKLVLAGDGPLRNNIIDLIDELKLRNDIILVGLIERNDVYCFLSICEFFIMPSISEGLNVAFLEALSLKTKIVVSDIPQFSYPFEHFKLKPADYNVFFTDPFCHDAIHVAFEKALRSHRNDNFSTDFIDIKQMADKYHKIYRKL